MTQPSWEIQPVIRVRDSNSVLRLGKYSTVNQAHSHYMNEWYDWYTDEHGDAPTIGVYEQQFDKVLQAMSKQQHRARVAMGFSQAGGDYERED